MARFDPPQITLDEVRGAAAGGNLGGTAARLARDRNWVSLGILFAYAGGPKVPLADVTGAARAMGAALGRGRDQDEPEPDGSRGVRLAAAEALLGRVPEPSSEAERDALRTAGEMLLDAGETRRAALAFERSGDDARAADAYGGVGDIERMEACLQREEARRAALANAADASRRFERLLADGEREAAVRAAAAIPDGAADAAGARQLAQALETRLVRGRAVTLRLPGGRPVRFAALPAALGRDAFSEVLLRDPGVSRRHAVLSLEAASGRVEVEDAGSRTGTTLGGLPIAGRLPLPDAGELGLGPTCRIAFRTLASARLELRGAAGLDRPLHAIVGSGALPVADAAPEAAGLRVVLGGSVARLERDASVPTRVEGRYVGGGCDLLHGDVIERIGPDGILRIEVE